MSTCSAAQASSCNGDHAAGRQKGLGDVQYDTAAIQFALANKSQGGSVSDARMVVEAASPFKCVGVNTALCRLMGLSQADIEGSSLKVLHGLDTRSVWDTAIETAANSTAPQDLRAMCNTAMKQKQLLRVQVSVLQQHANVPEDKEHKLMLLVLKLSSGVRTAEEAKADKSPGARVIIKNKAPFPIESVSSDWERMFGMAESAVVGRSLKVVQGPGTDSRAVSELMNAGARGVEGQTAFVTYTLEGKRLLTHHTCLPLLSANGIIESFVVEARSSEVVDCKDAMSMQKGMALVVSLESSNEVVHASGELCKLLKKDAGVVVGQPLSKILLGANAETLLKITTKAISGAPALGSVLVALCIADAEPMPMRISLRPVMDAQLQFSHVLHILEPCAVVSLTEAVANQNKNSDVDFIATGKAPYIVKHASKAWCDTYGLTEAEVTGRSLQIIHGPNTDKTVLNRIIEGAMAGAPTRETLTCYHKDGSAVQASMIVYPVMSKSGAIEHLRAVIDDIVFPDRARSSLSSQPESAEISQTTRDKRATNKIEYPITPEGHITHINGYTQLVLYPKADPTLKNCIVYLGKLKEASIVKSWNWEGDALRVNMDTQRVLAHTQKSAWCRMWTADLRTWDAWWNRMLWVVSEASCEKSAAEVTSLSHGGGDACAQEDFRSAHGKSARGPVVMPSTPALHSAVTRLDQELESSGMSSSICLVNMQGGIVFCNSAFSKVMKYSQEQLLGRSLFALCSDEVDVVEVKRIQMCMRNGLSSLNADCGTEAGKGFRLLTSCLELRNGDGATFWASIVGDPARLGTRNVEALQDATDCICLSIEDCSEIVLPDASREGEVLNEMTDPYTFYMAEELSFLQNEALETWKFALAELEAPAISTDQTPKDRERDLSDEELFKQEAVTASDAGEPARETSHVRERKILLQVPEDMRLRCVEDLWRLKAEGSIKTWAWDSEYLSLTINTREHCAVDAVIFQMSDPRKGASRKVRHRASKMEGYEELHHHARPALRLPEPGTDFSFLAADHGDADEKAAERKDEDAIAAVNKAKHISEEKMESLSSDVYKLEKQVAQLHLELAAEKLAKHSALARALALETELQAVRAQSEIERSVSSMALKAMETSLHRKTGEVEALEAQLLDLKDENTNLNGILDLVRQQGEAASCEKADEIDEDMSDDGFGHEVDAQETGPGQACASKKVALNGHDNGAMQVHEVRMHMPLVSADFVEKFQSFLNVDPVKTGFALCDESGAILWCNTELTEYIGYMEEDVRWCRWQSFLCAPGTDEQAIQRVRSCIKQRAPLSSCLQICREDGRIVWMHVRMEPSIMSNTARDEEVPVLLLCMHPASSTESSSEQQAEILEAAMIHGLDCVDVISRGFPVQDTAVRRNAAVQNGNGHVPWRAVAS